MATQRTACEIERPQAANAYFLNWSLCSPQPFSLVEIRIRSDGAIAASYALEQPLSITLNPATTRRAFLSELSRLSRPASDRRQLASSKARAARRFCSCHPTNATSIDDCALRRCGKCCMHFALDGRPETRTLASFAPSRPRSCCSRAGPTGRRAGRRRRNAGVSRKLRVAALHQVAIFDPPWPADILPSPSVCSVEVVRLALSLLITS